jgi:hypothetical protein
MLETLRSNGYCNKLHVVGECNPPPPPSERDTLPPSAPTSVSRDVTPAPTATAICSISFLYFFVKNNSGSFQNLNETLRSNGYCNTLHVRGVRLGVRLVCVRHTHTHTQRTPRRTQTHTQRTPRPVGCVCVCGRTCVGCVCVCGGGSRSLRTTEYMYVCVCVCVCV